MPLSDAQRSTVQSIIKAEELKKQGNYLFKARCYNDAIDLYTQAISAYIIRSQGSARTDVPTDDCDDGAGLPTELNPIDPTYLTNRAAAYIAIKRFRSALADCQLAATLQAATPAYGAATSKTLLRLARCQLALAQTEAALSTLRVVIAAEPASAPAADMHARALELQVYMRNLVVWRERGQWDMARIELEKCLYAIEAEGSEIPTEWRQWRIDIKREVVSSAAEYAPPPSPSSRTHFLDCPLPLLIFSDALRLKEEGNQAFKLGKLHEALSRYTDALKVRS